MVAVIVSRGGESVDVPSGAVVGFQGYDVVHNSTWHSDCSMALDCSSSDSSFAIVRQ
ncbi:MAG: hypothetical protein IT382_13720 [Deltaproteobacteria bacterium]|nr:hypothetical protein [Deltaproteobacteria bacterium]